LEVEKYIKTSHILNIPYIVEDTTINKLMYLSRKEVVRPNLSVGYDPTLGPTIAGKTIVESLAILVDPTFPNSYRSAKAPIQSTFQDPSSGLSYPSGINKSEYHALATNTNPVKSPEEIANEFKPKLVVNLPYYDFGLPKPVGSAVELESYIESGIDAVHYGEEVTSSYSPNITFKSPRILLNTSERISGNDGIPAIYRDAGVEFFRIKYYSKNVIKISQVLAHEFGHFLFSTKNRLSTIGWGALEKEYIIDSTGLSDPVFTGDGHLEGNPSGNSAGYHEMIFAQRFVMEELWGIAEKTIKSDTSITNSNEIIASIKVGPLLPYFLESDPALGSLATDADYFRKHKFRIRTYLKGNLSESDYKGIIPKL
jgi:hypothetical protein